MNHPLNCISDWSMKHPVDRAGAQRGSGRQADRERARCRLGARGARSKGGGVVVASVVRTLLPNSNSDLLPNPNSDLLPNPNSDLLPNPNSKLLPNPNSDLLPNPNSDLTGEGEVGRQPALGDRILSLTARG